MNDLELEDACARLGLTVEEAVAIAERLVEVFKPIREAAIRAVESFTAWTRTPEVQAWLAALQK